MDEVWLRLALVLTALAVVAASFLMVRRRSRPRRRSLPTTGLSVGVYLFTSSNCPDCEQARKLLAKAFGGDGYVEVSWDEDPAVLTRLGVEAVPATLVVGADGSGVLWPGVPDEVRTPEGP